MLNNFASTQPLETLLKEPDTLAVLRFEASELNSPAQTLGASSIRAQQLSLVGSHDGNDVEVWQVEGSDVEAGVIELDSGNLNWRRCDQLQFVSITAELTRNDDFAAVAKQVYSDLLGYINKSPHPQLVRFWNYVPHINAGDGDRENYKTFCTGRLAAFHDFKLNDHEFPAASAVGHYRDGITICALSAAEPVKHHANPRQVDAFKYPPQYGTSSPSFARATTLTLENAKQAQNLCFISGTASILGHSSVHRDDLRLQLYTTNDNILYLLKETGFRRDQIQTLRVYVRHTNHYAECRRIIEELYPSTPAIYIHADICRSELLVEVECFCVADA